MLVDTINKIKNVQVGYVGSNGLFDSATVNAYTSSLRGLSTVQAEVALSSAGLDKAQQKQILNKLAETNATVTLTSAEASEALTRKIGSQEAANTLLKKAGLVTEKQLETGVTITLNKELVNEAIALGRITQEEGEQILTTFGLTGANIGLTTSFKLLAKSIWANIKAMAKWLVTNPVGWCILAVGAIAGLVKGYDTLIGRQEKLSDQKLENLNENIDSLNEEISALEELQVKLENAKGKKSELAQIQNELNDAIGETTGLLNGEGKAYDIANAKLKANIELKKQQRDQALKDKIAESKVKFDNNVLEVDWSPDIDASKMREYAHEYTRLVEMYNGFTEDDKKKWKVDSLDEWLDRNFSGDGSSKIDVTSDYWTNYWDEQVQTAYDAFDDVIQDYDGVGGQDFIKNIINNMVRGGSDLSQISDVIFDIINNQDLQDKINEYWASLVDPEIDSEKALNAVKTMIDGIIKQYPQLESFFTDFYDGIVSGANVVADTVTDTANKIDDSRTKMISSINDMSEGFEELDKIYSSIKDDDPFDFKLLDDKVFKETFSDLDSYADFIEQITSNSDDIDACKDAFNDLVSEWINTSGILNNITEENEKLTIAMLKQMGVANAEEIVTAKTLAKTKAKLSAEEEFLTKKKEDSSIKSKDLTSATYEEISALWAESNASQATKQYLAQLALSKLNVQNVKINTKSDIDNIIALANAAGTSEKYVNALKTALNNLTNKKSSAINTSKDIGANYLAYGTLGIKLKNKSVENDLKSAEEEVNSILANIQKNGLTASDFYANVDYAGGSSSNKNGGGSSKDTAETFDWIEIKLQRLQRVIENLGKIVSATWKSWTDRNSALKSQISAVTQEISLQQQAYNRYMSLANSVGLDPYYQALVQNGAMNISTITDETLAEQIKAYQDYYEKALDAKDATIDLQDELANLARTEFDNVAKQFDDQINDVEKNISIIESYIDQVETRGNLVSKNYYSSLVEEESKNLSLLQNKYDELSVKINNGVIKQGSEEWYAMLSEIKDVKQEIIESTTALEEYSKTMRELDWEIFDLIQDKIGNVINESNDWIDLLSNSKLFNDDGSITSHGQTTIGLHAINLKVYENQVNDYAKAIKDLDTQFADDSLDKNYLERREELAELQRESILNCESEKSAIKDLMSESYDTMLSYMQQIIDKRKEMLSEITDTRSFQRSIEEQTAEVAKYQKIIQSMSNMSDTEEGKSTIQKYQVSLEEAEKNLEDTMYDKYISDQEKMLDSLIEDTETFITKRLDDTDKLISDVSESVDKNADTIKTTLEQEAEKAGGILSNEIHNIWNGTDGFTSIVSGVSNTLLDIKNLVKKMVDDGNVDTSVDIRGWNQNNDGTWSYTNKSGEKVTGWQKLSWQGKEDWYSFDENGNMHANKWIGDYFVGSSGQMLTDTWVGHNGIYYYVGSDGKWHNLPNWTSHGRPNDGYPIYEYAKGSRRIPFDQLAFLGENGQELKYDKNKGTLSLVGEGDMVWTNEQTKRLWELSKNFNPTMTNFKVPSYDFSKLGTNINKQSSSGDVIFEKIEMYGVNDPQEFANQLKDVYDKNIGNVRKMINTDVHSKYGSQDYRRYL